MSLCNLVNIFSSCIKNPWLRDHFEQKDVMKPGINIRRSLLLKSACGETCNSELKSFSKSVFQPFFYPTTGKATCYTRQYDSYGATRCKTGHA